MYERSLGVNAISLKKMTIQLEQLRHGLVPTAGSLSAEFTG